MSPKIRDRRPDVPAGVVAGVASGGVAGRAAGRRAGAAPVEADEDEALDAGAEDRPATLREASQLAEDAETELLAMFGDLTEGADALIFRANEHGRYAYVGTVDASLLSYEHIAKSYGPGRYSVKPRVPRASDGRKQFAGERKIEIAAPAPRVAAAAVSADGQPVSFDQVMSAGVLSMFQQMQAMNASTLELVRAAAREPAPPPPPPDIVGPLVSLVTAVAPIATAYLTSGKRDGDVLKIMRDARELLAPPRAPTPVTELVATMEAVERLRETVGAGNSERPGIGERLLETLAPLLVQGAVQSSARPAAAPSAAVAPVPALAPSAPAPVAPVTQPQEVTPMMARIAHLAKWIQPLLKWAAEDRDPATYAGVFYDELPVGLRAAALELVQRPTVVADIMQQQPGFAPYEAWVREWLHELTLLLNPPAPDDTVEG